SKQMSELVCRNVVRKFPSNYKLPNGLLFGFGKVDFLTDEREDDVQYLLARASWYSKCLSVAPAGRQKPVNQSDKPFFAGFLRVGALQASPGSRALRGASRSLKWSSNDRRRSRPSVKLPGEISRRPLPARLRVRRRGSFAPCALRVMVRAFTRNGRPKGSTA